MFVKQQKRKNGRVYLSVVQGYRDEAGRTRTRHVRSLGYLDELRGLYDDPVAHFRAEVEAENEAARAQAAPITVTLHPLERIDKRAEGRVEMGAAVPSAYPSVSRIRSKRFAPKLTEKIGWDACPMLYAQHCTKVLMLMMMP